MLQAPRDPHSCVSGCADASCAVAAQSGIHGWGLFAKVDMAQDTMVAEYRGVRLRREVADRREERYRREGKDCYLFAVSDDCVIDSTMRGTISRFTVRQPVGICADKAHSHRLQRLRGTPCLRGDACTGLLCTELASAAVLQI